ncbi:MAG: hypothetical protein IT386_16855 [Deltaproteobacteria bacterium]|nr:hypothetical protein [Deltaproteobacteria bacterium]
MELNRVERKPSAIASAIVITSLSITRQRDLPLVDVNKALGDPGAILRRSRSSRTATGSNDSS